MKRAVIYARVSGDDTKKEGRNIAGQLEMGQEYALEKGYQVVAELPEDEKRPTSGADFDLPQLERALEMAAVGEFDVLIVRELDRFARGLAKQLVVEQQFKRNGVEVEYVLGEYPDTPEGNLNKNVKAVIAEYEREKTRERVVRGIRLFVKNGSVMVSGRPPYGYRKVVTTDGKHTLEVEPEEAGVVKMIFDWYVLDNLSLNEIKRRLTEFRVPTPGENTRIRQAPPNKQRGPTEWSKSTLYRILNRQAYIGIWVYNSANFGQVTVEVPAIIDPVIFDLAQKKLAEGQEKSRRNLKNEYLLARRVRCGLCGYKMAALTTNTTHKGKTYPLKYYRCPSHAGETLAKCNAPHYNAKTADAMAWQAIKKWMASPGTIREYLEELKSERESELAPLRQRLAITEDLLAANQKQLDRLLDLYLSGEFDKDMLVGRKGQLEETVNALEREKAGLVNRIRARAITPQLVDEVLQKQARISRSLDNADNDFQARLEVFDLLEVQATLTVEGGKRVMYLNSIIGQIIAPDDAIFASTLIVSGGHNPQSAFALMERLVLTG